MKIKDIKILDFLYLSKSQAFDTLSDFFTPFYVKVYLAILIFLNLLNWVFVYYINKVVSQDLVVLHYNVNFGVNLIGSAGKIYTIPFLGLAFIILNVVLVTNIRKQDKFINHLLFFSLILANLFLLAATMSVYLVNFR